MDHVPCDTVPIFSEKEKTPCGFRNLGDMCFVNSTIQCLFSTMEFTNFLKDNDFEDKKTWKILKNLFLENKKSSVLSLDPLKQIFARHGQQDSSEFLSFLLNELKKEICETKSTQSINFNEKNAFNEDFPFLDLNFIENCFNNQPTFDQFISSPPPKTPNVIDDIFEGTITSKIVCSSCSSSIENHEPFLILHVPVPEGDCTLKNCIRVFQSPKTFNFFCCACGHVVSAQKIEQITSFPKVLVVHFLRNKKGPKISNSIVNIPNSLHLESEEQKIKFETSSLSYHNGTSSFGHYTSSIKENDKWWYLNDEKASPFDIKNLSNNDTDCLFLRKIKVTEKPTNKDQVSNETTISMVKDKKQNSKKISFDTDSQHQKQKLLKAAKKKIFENSKEILHEKYGCVVNYIDLGRLLSGRKYAYLMFLNSEIINFYFALICKRNKQYKDLPKVHFFNTYFYSQYKKNGLDYVKLWENSFGNIFQLDYLFVPINIENLHWTLVVIDFKKHRISYFDSLKGRNDECLSKILDFLEYKHFSPSLLDHVPKNQKENWRSLWTIDQPENIPSQHNGYDCGVFVLMYALYISFKKFPHFKQSEMKKFRETIMYHIIQGKIN
eukprot:TRINITY_DN1299_c0_g1_i7.p1 TRINITY_DN1299_c0_g1~~TRINITY_DN1299_c0_g1_i7.p1  ORF type:complete len:608 (+),score=156.06 TRINITY_DN1299_c0_g1_i7:7775-9598(+)